jgi:integrase/recombinase XerD
MPKAVLVSDQQFKHIIDVARVSSPEHALRNVALAYTLFATGLYPKEIAQLRVSDFLTKNGSVKEDSEVRAEIAFNCASRPLLWTVPKLVEAIDAYLDYRVRRSLGTSMRGAEVTHFYRGLNPKSALFLAQGGEGFAVAEVDKDGRTYVECNSMTRLLNRILSDANIDGLTTASARRTFAVKLYRSKRGSPNIRDIAEVLGLKSLKAVKELVETDPVSIREVIKGVI